MIAFVSVSIIDWLEIRLDAHMMILGKCFWLLSSIIHSFKKIKKYILKFSLKYKNKFGHSQ
jgi:hypothetical protein